MLRGNTYAFEPVSYTPLDVYKRQPQNRPNFDFFNYAGIHRPVVLYTTPKEYIEDVTVVPAVDGTVRYAVKTSGSAPCLLYTSRCV